MDDLEWPMIRHQQQSVGRRVMVPAICKHVFFFKQPRMITKSDTNI